LPANCEFWFQQFTLGFQALKSNVCLFSLVGIMATPQTLCLKMEKHLVQKTKIMMISMVTALWPSQVRSPDYRLQQSAVQIVVVYNLNFIFLCVQCNIFILLWEGTI